MASLPFCNPNQAKALSFNAFPLSTGGVSFRSLKLQPAPSRLRVITNAEKEQGNEPSKRARFKDRYVDFLKGEKQGAGPITSALIDRRLGNELPFKEIFQEYKKRHKNSLDNEESSSKDTSTENLYRQIWENLLDDLSAEKSSSLQRDFLDQMMDLKNKTLEVLKRSRIWQENFRSKKNLVEGKKNLARKTSIARGMD